MSTERQGDGQAVAMTMALGLEIPREAGKPQFITDAETQQKIDIAVSRERERCAKIADGLHGSCSSTALCCACSGEIAENIRKG